MDDASVRAEFASLWFNTNQLSDRVRTLEKMIDTRDSPWWKRLQWRLQGFPPWYRVGSARAWWKR